MIVDASEQPASRSGRSTVFSGDRIFAVSAMKWTPQNTMTSAVGRRGLPREPERVADVVGDVLDLGHLVVVRQDHRVALARERPDALRQLGDRKVRVLAAVPLRLPLRRLIVVLMLRPHRLRRRWSL